MKLDHSKIEEITNNFANRNIEALWFDCFGEIKEYLLKIIPDGVTVGIGNSRTLKDLGITEALAVKGNIVYDKELGTAPDKIKELKRKALLADYYISGSNAVSADGMIVNIDHSGNRVAAITYGPEKVFIVAGKNKIAATCDEAVKRAKNTAAPMNAKRAGLAIPLTQL